MLFHTPEFIFFFLPVTLLVYFLAGRFSLRGAFACLTLASLFFYGWWAPSYLLLIVASIIFNYFAGIWLCACNKSQTSYKKLALSVTVSANLLLLAYYKYLMFFAAQASLLFHTNIDVGNIILPIGISFYTFTQIAYLADVAKGKDAEQNFISYALFVTYFPHLVAGPILHHAEMMPQFSDPANLKINPDNMARGLTFFAFGLFKKIVFADGCGPIANQAFSAAAQGGLSSLDAWTGTLAYTLQIYYDFSGYSDMAVGLSLLFNVNLPINFYAPYQARNIIDFWRRWHMTLSRFLRDYLYIPLGGSRKGQLRRSINLAVTMLLGGLWHGANWTFVIWGGLHGLYLGVNHAWRALANRRPALQRASASPPLQGVYWLLTLLAVMLAWVFFRAGSFAEAMAVLQPMFGLNTGSIAEATAIFTRERGLWLATLLIWALAAPNTNRFLNYHFGAKFKEETPLAERLLWRPRLIYALTVGVLLFTSAVVGIAGRDRLEFLYFRF